jgi:hypothetical protein
MKTLTRAALVLALAPCGGCSNIVATQTESAAAANAAVAAPASTDSKRSAVERQPRRDPDTIAFGTQRWWQEQERDGPGTP